MTAGMAEATLTWGIVIFAKEIFKSTSSYYV